MSIRPKPIFLKDFPQLLKLGKASYMTHILLAFKMRVLFLTKDPYAYIKIRFRISDALISVLRNLEFTHKRAHLLATLLLLWTRMVVIVIALVLLNMELNETFLFKVFWTGFFFFLYLCYLKYFSHHLFEWFLTLYIFHVWMCP